MDKIISDDKTNITILTISFPNDGKKLRRFIIALLKSKLAIEIKKMNYISSYKLIDDKIYKNEEKILSIFFLKENKTKLEGLIQKLHPDKNFIIFSL